MLWGFRQLQYLAVDEWISRQKGGHLQFLTNQGLLLAAMTMALGLLADLVPIGATIQLKRALLIISLPVLEANLVLPRR